MVAIMLSASIIAVTILGFVISPPFFEKDYAFCLPAGEANPKYLLTKMGDEETLGKHKWRHALTYYHAFQYVPEHRPCPNTNLNQPSRVRQNRLWFLFSRPPPSPTV